MKIIKNIKSILGILFLGILMSSCGLLSDEKSSKSEHQAEEAQGDEHGGHDEHGEEGVVSLTEQQIKAIELKMVQIEERNMNIGVEVTGKLELAPRDRADINPILGGVVKEINVIEGDKVRKGQVLATLEHPDFIQLQQDYINSINTLEFLKKDFQRQKKLYEEKVGSGREFQRITADYNNTKSIVKGLEIKLKMLGLNTSEIAKGTIYPIVKITSPMNGIISLVQTNIGAYVAPLTKLFEVLNNDKLHADFRVYEKDMHNIKVGQKLSFTTTSQLEDEFEGEIYAISPAFESNPKALHIHAKILSNKKSLISGMYIQGKIIAKNSLVKVLPEHAIVSEEDKTFIFVKKNDKHSDEKEDEHGHSEKEGKKVEFERVEVITGIFSEGFVEVKLLKPLPENAQIAGNGAYYLLAEMGKGETEHTH